MIPPPPSDSPLIIIVILNYGGWRDTLECLDSLRNAEYPNYRAVVIDNGSQDESCDRIRGWAQDRLSLEAHEYSGQGERYGILADIEVPALTQGKVREIENLVKGRAGHDVLILARSLENLGFARACNIGIRYAMAAGAEFVLLLNNDTMVSATCLSAFVGFMNTHPAFEGATAEIRLHFEPSRIWNCGGVLTRVGGRKYLYPNCSAIRRPNRDFTAVTYITGCAALFRTRIFARIGLLSEAFFFGEEDFELCHRLKAARAALACVHSAVVYHKVGRTITRLSGPALGRAYYIYLSRLLCMRLHWPRTLWKVWMYLYMVRISYVLRWQMSATWGTVWHFVKHLLHTAPTVQVLDRRLFEHALQGQWSQ